MTRTHKTTGAHGERGNQAKEGWGTHHGCGWRELTGPPVCLHPTQAKTFCLFILTQQECEDTILAISVYKQATVSRAGKRAQRVKGLAVKPEDPSLIAETHMVGENPLLKAVL